jgi:hypothetical protein
VIRAYDDAGNVIETHERRGRVQRAMIEFLSRCAAASIVLDEMLESNDCAGLNGTDRPV